MRILHIISTFPPAYAFGGPPKVTFDICTELVKKGYEVTVYATNAYDQKSNFKVGTQKTVINGIKVNYFPNLLRTHNLFVSPMMIFRLRKTLTNFDVVHLHFGRQLYDIYVGLFAKKFDLPYVIQAHGSIPEIGERKYCKTFFDICLGRRIIRNSCKTIALNDFEAEQYKLIGVEEEKIAIIPNGINLSEYAYLPSKGCFKRKFGIPEETKIILYLGRIHKIKGIDLLIKAYAYLTQKICDKDTVLVIAGPDDGYLKEAKNLAKSLGIHNSVLFSGPFYGIAKLETYIDSYLYALPSRYETFPMVVLEAYACSKPVVASDLRSLESIIINGKTGLLFKPGNVKQLADKIYQLLNDDEMTKKMGLNGRRFVEEKFAIEKCVMSLDKLYHSVRKNT